MTAFRLALVGNPNCGKTTVFNALTGARQQIGNWPGVTVERKSGRFDFDEHAIEVIDLPGLYAMTAPKQAPGIDTAISCEFLAACTHVDLIVNVIDATQLERHLFLTLQLLALQKPMLLVLNMMDQVNARQLTVDIEKLSALLGCPVVPITASRQRGMTALKQAIVHACQTSKTSAVHFDFPNAVEAEIATRQVEDKTRVGVLCELMLDDEFQASPLAVEMTETLYAKTQALVQEVVQVAPKPRLSLTKRIDRWVLHRWFALPIFFSVIYLTFFIAVALGGALQDFFDLTSQALFIQAPEALLTQWHSPPWVTLLIAKGLGLGINTILVFVPVITLLFLCLTFLEASGYMARAAFVMDRLMRTVGLPGRSFVPLMLGFGCNVPAIMAARTLSSPHDRILTILMTPFMSCSARLAIFAVFAAAFFPHGAHNVIFGLYLFGIVMAILTGWIFRKTVLKAKQSPMILELPNYHLPTFRALWRQTFHRLKQFLVKAGKFILPVCLVMAVLNSVSLTAHGLSVTEAGTSSLLAQLGQGVTPLFAPMGITASNWPATVGLFTGALAKEVVLATLNTLYSHTQVLADPAIVETLRAAGQSLLSNLALLPQALWHPLLTTLPQTEMTPSLTGTLVTQFASPWAAMAYLLFVLLYIPCVSTAAVMGRELNYTWASVSIGWSLILAYAMAVICYQVSVLSVAPVAALSWIVGAVGLLGLSVALLTKIKLNTMSALSVSPCHGCTQTCKTA